MTNPYYQPGEHRAAQVGALFGRIAPRYDLINDLQSLGLHRLWKRRLARLAEARPGHRALDLCCGTGDIAFALARRGAEVVGIDFSGPMLAVARRRAAKFAEALHEPRSSRGNETQTFPDFPAGGDQGLVTSTATVHGPDARPKLELAASCTPEFIRGDALHVPFPDNSFDIVTMGYGLRNLTEWKAGLREMLRVAKPGARLLVLDFGKPPNALWRAAYFGYLRLCVPLFGLVFCRDAAAYAYILESLRHFPAQRGIDEQLRALGCRDTRVIEPLGGVMGLNVGLKPWP